MINITPPTIIRYQPNAAETLLGYFVDKKIDSQ